MAPNSCNWAISSNALLLHRRNSTSTAVMVTIAARSSASKAISNAVTAVA
jgi:hypothetical protein